MFAQVGGLYRRQNSGNPLFFVRRAQAATPVIRTKKRRRLVVVCAFCVILSIQELRGDKQTLVFAQVGGLYRRQNSGNPLFFVRRAQAATPVIRTKKRRRLVVVCAFCVIFIDTGVEGRQTNTCVCAGRRALPPTKQRRPAVFRAPRPSGGLTVAHALKMQYNVENQ